MVGKQVPAVLCVWCQPGMQGQAGPQQWQQRPAAAARVSSAAADAQQACKLSGGSHAALHVLTGLMAT